MDTTPSEYIYNVIASERIDECDKFNVTRMKYEDNILKWGGVKPRGCVTYSSRRPMFPQMYQAVLACGCELRNKSLK